MINSNQKLDLATFNTEFGNQQILNNTVKEKVDTTARGIYVHQPSVKYIHKDYGYVEGMVVGRDSKKEKKTIFLKKSSGSVILNIRFAF